jgi:hypothetical protein
MAVAAVVGGLLVLVAVSSVTVTLIVSRPVNSRLTRWADRDELDLVDRDLGGCRFESEKGVGPTRQDVRVVVPLAKDARLPDERQQRQAVV